MSIKKQLRNRADIEEQVRVLREQMRGASPDEAMGMAVLMRELQQELKELAATDATSLAAYARASGVKQERYIRGQARRPTVKQNRKNKVSSKSGEPLKNSMRVLAIASFVATLIIVAFIVAAIA